MKHLGKDLRFQLNVDGSYVSLDGETSVTGTLSAEAASASSKGGVVSVVDYGVSVTSITSSTVALWNGGANIPAGRYTITYVSGAISYANDGRYGVRQYYTPPSIRGPVVFYGANNTDAPGTVTYSSTISAAENANIGQQIAIDHTGGTIGVGLVDAPYVDNAGTPVAYRLTRQVEEPWNELLAGCGLRSASIKCSGFTVTMLSSTVWGALQTASRMGDVIECQVVYIDPVTMIPETFIAFTGLVTSFDRAGDKNAAETYSVALESIGVVATTPGPTPTPVDQLGDLYLITQWSYTGSDVVYVVPTFHVSPYTIVT